MQFLQKSSTMFDTKLAHGDPQGHAVAQGGILKKFMAFL